MGFRAVWHTPEDGVNHRIQADMRRDVQKGLPNSTPSPAFGPPVG